MARTIDPQNIDDDDAKYILERPWIMEEFGRQGFIDEMNAVREGIKIKDDPTDDTRVHTEDMSLGNSPQTIDKPRSNGVVDDDPLDDSYEEWTKEDLVAEIETRNKETDRDESMKISKSGTKQDLATRLHEDDMVEV